METITTIAIMTIGLAIYCVVQLLGSRKAKAIEDKVMKGYFLLGLSGLMAKIAMADGKVTNDEAEMANRFFAKMELTDAERAMCIGNFVTSRRDGLETRDHAKRFMAYSNAAACEYLYDLLWRISNADGHLDSAEDKMLLEIASYLGLGESVYQRFKAGERTRYDEATLRAAGVPASLAKLARQSDD